ncbi:glycosyltransferase [Enterococcus sp. CSURQ0835]|uniref:glycosyltransferase n=1 Tax=Enterococcus sp. CSURQ0835 TaxID=2681394 RepID=UPI001356A997|nr:glycosyltransferase [Enterococcus sp. CSURQ0835]
MEKSEPVIISIVTHNSDKLFMSLATLIESLGEEANVLIKIFDNHSDEEYRKRLKEYATIPFVEVVFHPANKGFGFGHNQNLLTASERYGIIFNPDILLKEEVITKLVLLLKLHPECSMVAPKILNQDGSTQYLIRQRLSVFDYALRFIPFKFVKKMFAKRLARFECRDLPDDRDSYVRMISGSFMVVDLAAFRELDGFDERYFMYFEDNDLCFKMEAAGHKILYTPRYQVTHLYERGAVKNRKLFLTFLQSMGKFFHKWGWHWF